jgi:hypothetical protein
MVKGTITKVGQRGKAWDIYLGDKRYGAGFKAPSCQAGDVVKFEVEVVEWKGTNYDNVKEGTLEVLPEEKPTATTAKPAPKGGGDSKPSQAYWDSKDRKITFLACQKDALQLVDIALRNEALSLGAAKGKKMGVLLSEVQQVTRELYNYVVSGAYDVSVEDAVDTPAGAVGQEDVE